MADSVERVNSLVQEDLPITAIDIAEKLGVSCGFAYSVISEDLGYHEICARWVPKRLTDEHKQACIETFMQFLQ
jgi:hypothetical protein